MLTLIFLAGIATVLFFEGRLLSLFIRARMVESLASQKVVYSARNALPLFLVAALLMTACGVSEDAVSEGELHLTFDGESCTYEGPTFLKAGPVTLHFYNDSEGLAEVDLTRHTGDETIQDSIDYIGEEPSLRPAAPWMQDIGYWPLIQAGESFIWEGELEPGIHFMVCVGGLSLGRVWVGTGLEVVE